MVPPPLSAHSLNILHSNLPPFPRRMRCARVKPSRRRETRGPAQARAERPDRAWRCGFTREGGGRGLRQYISGNLSRGSQFADQPGLGLTKHAGWRGKCLDRAVGRDVGILPRSPSRPGFTASATVRPKIAMYHLSTHRTPGRWLRAGRFVAPRLSSIRPSEHNDGAQVGRAEALAHEGPSRRRGRPHRRPCGRDRTLEGGRKEGNTAIYTNSILTAKRDDK